MEESLMLFFGALLSTPGFYSWIKSSLELGEKLKSKHEPKASDEIINADTEDESQRRWLLQTSAKIIKSLEKKQRDTLADVDEGDISAFVKKGLDSLIDTKCTEKKMRSAFSGKIPQGLTLAALKDLARTMIKELCEDDSLWKIVVLEEIAYLRSMAEGSITYSDLEKMTKQIEDVVSSDYFLDKRIQKRASTEREKWEFVDPPVEFNGESLKSSAVENLMEWLKGNSGSVLLVKGPAGIGKSRFAWELVRHMTKQASDKAPPIPIYLTHDCYEGWKSLEDVISFIINMQGFHPKAGIDKRSVVRLMLRYCPERFVFIFDSLDQVPNQSSGNLATLLSGYDGLCMNTVVVLGRDEGFSKLSKSMHTFDQPTMRMLFFDENKVEMFKDSNSVKLSSDWEKHLNDDSENAVEERMYNTPMMLILMLEVAQDGQLPFPTTKEELFESFLEKIIQEELRKDGDRVLTRSDIRKAWECIAYQALSYWHEEDMGKGAVRFEPQRQMLRESFVTSVQLRNEIKTELSLESIRDPMVSKALSSAIIGHPKMFESTGQEPSTEVSGDHCFMHLSLQEYLAAKAFLGKFNKLFMQASRDKDRIEKGLCAWLRECQGGDEFCEDDLISLWQFEPTKNAAVMIAEMLDSDEMKGDDDTHAWVDAFLEGLLSDEDILRYDKRFSGELRTGRQKRNTHRSNLLRTAMMVRDLRYEASKNRKESGVESSYLTCAYLEGVWEEKYEEEKQRYSSWVERVREEVNIPKGIVAEGKDWSEEWVLIRPGVSIVGSWQEEHEQPIRKLSFPIGDDGLILMKKEKVSRDDYDSFAETDASISTDYDDTGPIVFRKYANNMGWKYAKRYCCWMNRSVEGGEVRLPWELEWEYACKAGSTTEYMYTNDKNRCRDGGGGRSHPWGLTGMQGVLWEWCEDMHKREAYSNLEKSKDEGKADRYRVVRGGSWYDSAAGCRSAFRCWFPASYRLGLSGFRVCLVPGP